MESVTYVLLYPETTFIPHFETDNSNLLCMWNPLKLFLESLYWIHVNNFVLLLIFFFNFSYSKLKKSQHPHNLKLWSVIGWSPPYLEFNAQHEVKIISVAAHMWEALHGTQNGSVQQNSSEDQSDQIHYAKCGQKWAKNTHSTHFGTFFPFYRVWRDNFHI